MRRARVDAPRMFSWKCHVDFLAAHPALRAESASALAFATHALEDSGLKRHTYGTPFLYHAGMAHHNPMDPRDPLSPALYFTFFDNEGGGGRRGGGRRPGSGCGCAVMLVVIFLALSISSLTWR